MQKNARRKRRGQAIIEYVLVTAMVAAIIAVIIRGSTVVLYRFWSGLVWTVAVPCPDPNCTAPAPPELP